MSSQAQSLYHRVMEQSSAVRSHLDMLNWLQGDFQSYVAHDIMLAAWGDFESEPIQVHHDIISANASVRTQHLRHDVLHPLLRRTFKRWCEKGKSPYFDLVSNEQWGNDAINWGNALRHTGYKALSILVHGISDKRSQHETLYVVLNSKISFDATVSQAMATLTPLIDVTLRQVDLLSDESYRACSTSKRREYALTKREVEILYWVSLGKTNSEIGSILNISEFTVKNHMKRIFNKINVTNRAQAVMLMTKELIDLKPYVRC